VVLGANYVVQITERYSVTLYNLLLNPRALLGINETDILKRVRGAESGSELMITSVLLAEFDFCNEAP
jgi:hypothetical protein